MGGVSLNPSLFSALFLVVNDTDQGLPLDTGFTSPFLCEGVCVGVKKNCVCMSSFSKKRVSVCKAPLEVSIMSESRIPGIPDH